MTTTPKEQIIKSRTILQNPYAHMNGDGEFDALLNHMDDAGRDACIIVGELRSLSVVDRRISSTEIESIVRAFQIQLWKKRKSIWGEKAPDDAIGVLDPAAAFKAIGYDFKYSGSRGQYRTATGAREVAGYINKLKRYAGVSGKLSRTFQKFTAAHELGHALLHDAVGLHRDRGLDGSPPPGPRDRKEVEADIFAKCFLMPNKHVRFVFLSRFYCEKFIISDNSAYQLGSLSLQGLKSMCKSRRDLSRMLAGAERYSQLSFESMAQQFGVSIEAMAIRLEELDLV